MTAAEHFDPCQRAFHRRWPALRDPHVRALAWLLTSPALLDAAAPRWGGKLASVDLPAPAELDRWLNSLDAAPDRLHDALKLQPLTRLGRYAENLLAFYLREQGVLVAQGVQVRDGRHATVGEFDFLVRDDDRLLHWELATKLYLLERNGAGMAADYFIGPNLADTLGSKMRKIFDRQLALAEHPAAQAVLPRPVDAAQALVKGWLFYHRDDVTGDESIGVNAGHCRGFWCELSRAAELPMQYAVALSRLAWLAPARVPEDQMLEKDALLALLHRHFAAERMPVLVVLVEPHGGAALEVARGFIVPDDWQSRARSLGVVGS